MIEILDDSNNDHFDITNLANGRGGSSVSGTTSDSEESNKLLLIYTVFLLMFQTVFRISDRALDILLTFFSTFFQMVGKCLSLDTLTSVSSKMPSNLRQARMQAGGRQSFMQYVCCPKCHSTYTKDECVFKDEKGSVSVAFCSYVRFPAHPQRSRRLPCNTPLMKKVRTLSGNTTFRPYLIYCYKSLVDSLQMLLSRPNFFVDCEKWRKRSCTPGCYSDIYDGRIWHEFQSYNGQPFLSVPYNFAFQLNVDWFQPYDHTPHSEGVIFLTILNLPCTMRYRQENTLLLGVIPGPHEPKLHINSFLQPLVDDLLKLWNGVILKTYDGTQRIVRGALLCAACDVPAARKVCGFVGHGATRGCSRCLSKFPVTEFKNKLDYSNFNRETWILRTRAKHQKWCERYLSCNTRMEQVELERKYGVRFSCLSKLPYFDCSRMCIVDPMHNLLLGTAKRVMKIWLASEVLSEKRLLSIQEVVDTFITPIDIGRVPLKIASKFSGFTAEQWKSWVLYFSLPALKPLLPAEHYDCWHKFVQACYFFCRRTITDEEIKCGDETIMKFCESFLSVYGKVWLTPNIHLHGHLASFNYDFGPVYSFWLFPYERLNGVLGSYHSNSHNISVQLMTRFLDHDLYSSYKWPEDMVGTFYPLIEKCIYNKGSLQQKGFETVDTTSITPIPPVYEDALTSDEWETVSSVVTSIPVIGKVLLLHKVAAAVKLNDLVLGSAKSRVSKASLVYAELEGGSEWLCDIEKFIGTTVVNDNTSTIVWLAVASVYMRHAECKYFGYPVQIWSLTQRSSFVYLPTECIKSRVIATKMSIEFSSTFEEIVYVTVPLEHK